MKKYILYLGLLLCLFATGSHPCLAEDSSSLTPAEVVAVAPSGGAVPIGTVIIWPFTSNPEGWSEGKWLECNGQAITSSSYPELYALGYSIVPDFREKTLWGDTIPRTKKTAGLPNITGSMLPSDGRGGEHSGAFYSVSRSGWRDAGKGGTEYVWYFDASRCSSIYGAANTVQPPALTTRFLIRAKS